MRQKCVLINPNAIFKIHLILEKPIKIVDIHRSYCLFLSSPCCFLVVLFWVLQSRNIAVPFPLLFHLKIVYWNRKYCTVHYCQVKCFEIETIENKSLKRCFVWNTILGRVILFLVFIDFISRQSLFNKKKKEVFSFHYCCCCCFLLQIARGNWNLPVSKKGFQFDKSIFTPTADSSGILFQELWCDCRWE